MKLTVFQICHQYGKVSWDSATWKLFYFFSPQIDAMIRKKEMRTKRVLVHRLRPKTIEKDNEIFWLEKRGMRWQKLSQVKDMVKFVAQKLYELVSQRCCCGCRQCVSGWNSVLQGHPSDVICSEYDSCWCLALRCIFSTDKHELWNRGLRGVF